MRGATAAGRRFGMPATPYCSPTAHTRARTANAPRAVTAVLSVPRLELGDGVDDLDDALAEHDDDEQTEPLREVRVVRARGLQDELGLRDPASPGVARRGRTAPGRPASSVPPSS